MARILVVDDDYAARLLVRTLAEHSGHEVIEAADGAQACALAFECKPDLIIVDLSMPDMDGPQFVRVLRGDARTRSTRIALYTATMRTAAIDDFVKIYGLSGVLPKPGEPSDLLAGIDAALRAPAPIADRG